MRTDGFFVAAPNGNSMYPMVRHQKDPVFIQPAGGMLKKYDVAVYRQTGRYVAHRVLECRPGYYVTRGDNCVAKEQVPAGDIVGVVSGFWRHGRYIPVTNPLYKAYSRVWVTINPLVKAHHFIRSAVRSVLKSLHSS